MVVDLLVVDSAVVEFVVEDLVVVNLAAGTPVIESTTSLISAFGHG